VPKSALETQGALADEVLISVRPQSIQLARQQSPVGAGRCCVPARVALRAYLGEYWDYQVELLGAKQRLRVTARPQEVFEVGEPVWVDVDVAQLVVIGTN
jgi:ABC-type Fe3+/spermidine/putrescine transport system ATPase subunit